MIAQTRQKHSLARRGFGPSKRLNQWPTNPKNKLLTVSVGVFMLLLTCSLDAATPMPAESQFNVSLNGQWRFKLEQENGKSKRPASYGEKAPLELPATFEPFYQDQLLRKGLLARPQESREIGKWPAILRLPIIDRITPPGSIASGLLSLKAGAGAWSR